MNGRRPCRLAAVLAAIATAGAGVATAQSGGAEWLMGVRKQGNWRLERLDPNTGVEIGGTYFPSPSPLGVGLVGLTWSGERLLTVNIQPIADVSTEIHPADAVYTAIGLTGLNVGYQSIERRVQSGVVYLATYSSLYTLNPATGAVALVAPFAGFAHPSDGIYAMAIDSAGNAIGMGGELQNQVNTVYSIDLATANLNAIGMIQGIGDGWFRDIAISGTGDVWASFYDIGLNPGARGLYRLDAANGYWPTFVRPMTDPYWGLAFVPAPVQSIYCTAKANSAGCSPVVSGDGWPSPTASSGYVIRCDDVVNQTVGVLLYTASGRATLPFGGGTLCIAAPRRRTPLRQSGGSPAGWNDCSGEWSVDFNSHLQTQAQLPAGLTLRCQWMGRDSGFAPPNNYQLSNALEFTLEP
ncbi:MAG: hypothetical protein Q8K63_07600 [Acidimicrobiales bacterium]|nr:hypothetical protein [Acidimicrobiales bacterium]